MSEAGRKLTIRMPDNPSLRSVEVGQMHVDPGGRVLAGTPVMSLAKKRRDHIVRAPRSGRIVPLVAVGDKIEPGDPLYILHIDEAALAEAKKDKNALVPVEQAKWAKGITPDAIRPIARGRKRKEKRRGRRIEPGGAGRFAARWGKPVLAIALYVLACFALLPILHAFAAGASASVLAAMSAGALLFGALIYYLYRPDQGAGPRWTVRMIAASWVGIAGLAIFYQPDVTEDLTIADATGMVGDLFTIKEEALEVAEPSAVAQPPAVLASGVRFGRTLAISAPRHEVPRSVLPEPALWDDPHNVTVRAWGRVNPTNRSGEVLAFDLADAEAAPAPADSVVQHSDVSVPAPAPAGDLLLAGMGTAPSALAGDPDGMMAEVPIILSQGGAAPNAGAAPGLAARNDPSPASAAPAQVAGADLAPGSLPGSSRGQQDAWLSIEGVPVLAENAAKTASPTELSWQPPEEHPGGVAPRAPSAPVAVAAAPKLAINETRAVAAPAQLVASAGPGWLSNNGVPVLMSRGGAGLAPRDMPWRGQIASLRPDRAAAPLRPSFASNPDLLLVGLLRAGDENWMREQAALLGVVSADASPVGAATGQARAPVVAAVSPGPALSALAADDAPQTPATRAEADGSARTQVGKAPLRAVDLPLDGRVSLGEAAPQPSAGAAPAGLQLAAIPAAAPTAPVPDPGTEERRLLFVYFDDPRLPSHPGVGDTWAAPVSAALTDAVRVSEVVAVKQIVQVESWCKAASDPEGALSPDRPDGFQTALLSDRIRLLEVRVEIDAGQVAAFETELPLFSGQPAGFFHNRAPLMGALPGAPILEDGMAYLRSLSAGIIDPNQPSVISGGQYFDSPVALAAVLRGAGCVKAEWNGGDGPDNAIGRTLNARLDG